jgi:apolipoprotein N-acyltransferase
MLSHPFGQGADVYDSAVLFTEAGDVAGLYDKARLIPFLEFVPLERYFPRLAENLKARMPHWRPELTPGEAAVPLVDDDLRIGPMICSEELHMAHAHELARQEINLLVTIGSDAWFPAAASQQHRVPRGGDAPRFGAGDEHRRVRDRGRDGPGARTRPVLHPPHR